MRKKAVLLAALAVASCALGHLAREYAYHTVGGWHSAVLICQDRCHHFGREYAAVTLSLTGAPSCECAGGDAAEMFDTYCADQARETEVYDAH